MLWCIVWGHLFSCQRPTSIVFKTVQQYSSVASAGHSIQLVCAMYTVIPYTKSVPFCVPIEFLKNLIGLSYRHFHCIIERFSNENFGGVRQSVQFWAVPLDNHIVSRTKKRLKILGVRAVGWDFLCCPFRQSHYITPTKNMNFLWLRGRKNR